MVFNLEKAICVPSVRRIIEKRDGVLNHFGPIFRQPLEVKKDDYLNFLSIQYNCHWSGLERLGHKVAEDMDNLRHALSILVDESQLLSRRLDKCLQDLQGVGHATLTAILLVAYPAYYGVWNSTSECEMKEKGLWPSFERGASIGQKYEVINEVLLGLAKQYSIDTWTLDALWWAEKAERYESGHYKNAWDIAIWSMVDQAEQTTKNSNGQLVERTIKNKNLRFDKENLIKYLKKLLEESHYRCAITGLELQPKGPDPQLMPSLDRIDSNGHYEADNLQVVARFINFWKRDTPDAEFRRQLALVRGE